MHIYPGQTYPTPPIDHRSVQHHYTASVSHIEECTCPTPQIEPTATEPDYTVSFQYSTMQMYRHIIANRKT